MPQAIAITIDNGATTPVAKTFELLNPAAGLDSQANWALREGSISAVFPTISGVATTNSVGRRVRIKLTIPSSYTDAVTGLTNVGSRAEFSVTAILPTDFPESLKNDFAAYAKNLVANALINAMIRDGYPAT